MQYKSAQHPSVVKLCGHCLQASPSGVQVGGAGSGGGGGKPCSIKHGMSAWMNESISRRRSHLGTCRLCLLTKLGTICVVGRSHQKCQKQPFIRNTRHATSIAKRQYSEKPGFGRLVLGPYSLWARLAVVWLCIHSTAPAPRCCRCGGWTGRGTLCLRLSAAWPCPAPLTDTRCTHVRASLLLLLAVVHRPPASCYQPPPLPAAYIRAARRASPQTTGCAGGKTYSVA